MLKKIFIGAVIFFIIALGLFWYFVFYNKSAAPTNSPVTVNSNSLPFGEGGNITIGENSATSSASSGSVTIPLSKLMKISQNPVAGATVSTLGSTTLVRYTELGTAHVTEVNLLSGTTSQISNTTIPAIDQALWATNSSIILRYPNSTSDGIVSYDSALVANTGSSTPMRLIGSYLPNNIESLAVRPDGKSLVYMVGQDVGESAVIANADGSKPSTLFNSSFGEWNIAWPNASTLALTTKPAADVKGYLYFVDIKSTAMKKIVSGISGLNTLVSPDLSTVAYSDDNNTLSIYDVKTGLHSGVAETLADKCVWSKTQAHTIYCAVPLSIPSGLYPDAWYQGQVSFTDAIYRIDTATYSSVMIGDLAGTYQQNIDATNLMLSPDESYLIFTNKKDFSLWSFNLK